MHSSFISLEFAIQSQKTVCRVFHFHQFPTFLHLIVFSCILINFLHTQLFKYLFLTLQLWVEILNKNKCLMLLLENILYPLSKCFLKIFTRVFFFPIASCKSRNSENVAFTFKGILLAPQYEYTEIIYGI